MGILIRNKYLAFSFKNLVFERNIYMVHLKEKIKKNNYKRPFLQKVTLSAYNYLKTINNRLDVM